MKRPGRLARFVGVAGLTVGTLSTAGLAASALVMSTPAAAATCSPAGTTGLTADLIASPGETINAFSFPTVDATGCDIGIYVGPGVDGVTIGGPNTNQAITVENANDTGIFAEQNSGLLIQNNTITGNGADPNTSLEAFGGVVLSGEDTATVSDNSITDNGGGGVFVTDNGPTDPGAVNPGPGTPVPGSSDTVSDNTISGNYGNCGIVYVTHNGGGSVTGGTISGNTITGHVGDFKTTGPDVGGIVVAAAAPSATVSTTSVTGNTVSASFEGGIIVHSHAPHDVVSGTTITGNTVGPANNWGQTNGPPTTVGIILGVDLLPPALAASITGTTVASNTITGQFYGLWISGVPATDITTTPANTIGVLSGGTAIYTTPVPGTGYWQVASDGGIFNYGSAGFYGSAGSLKLNQPIVGMTATQDQGGYWLVASDGGIFSYGDASFFGSTGSIKLNKPIVGMAATPYVPGAGGTPASPAGLGYWLVASDGGIFSYGDAAFYGSTGGLKLNQPIVGMAPTPDGKGYWLVASDGGIFSYGDAAFYGSTGSIKLNKPIVGMAPTTDGKGYWLVASDGGIFNYGDAAFFGSAGSIKLNQPIVGMSATPDGKGYWLNASDGGIFSYGDATFYGSAGNIKLNKPIVGSTVVGTTASG